ncbi:methionine ABC transporter ATP-binding protein [Microbacterium sediminis]|uniref:Methionine ABC transporter ATP-binding protein n=1 Tax=Microbacterium sediminis TaxID=904291 RepID=A0A1B9NFY8_9MICO|nr:ATP-binding cassette domain-containing protein [Microbacterium sediminis]OCG75531.1 methionine ABC transporter ATP-binding protein [Microbacterium sediminis]QBR73926.1 ATP-binding cassette domain-containing protein [Microbacterium sediminis]
MITISHLIKSYGDTRALDDVSLTVERGEIYGVVGTSGAGKSTLIRTVNGLETPDSGTVEVDGTVITGLTGGALRAARHRIGMIFQHFNLLSRRTVAGNVSLALEAQGLPRAARKARVAEILDLVGLADRAGHYPAQLSGGQKQRVGIARALATNPSVLLSDEATSALDPETTASILQLLARLNRELGLTILLITHEMDVVKQICTSAALMQRGRIVEAGRLRELLLTPGSVIARQLFPLGEAPVTPGATVLDLTFTELTAHDPVIARLAREQGLDIGLLGAAIETIDGVQSGRTRLELPAGADVTRAIASLREQGIVVEEVAA